MEGDCRNFSCENCSKRYLRKNNLEDHVLMEHPDSEQASEIVAQKASRGRSKGSLIIECEICSKRFRYQSDLKNHFESHFRQPSRRGRASQVLPGLNHRNLSPSKVISPRVPHHLPARSKHRPDVHTRHEAAFESARHEEGWERAHHRHHQETRPPALLQMIDRTVEEFGEDWDEDDCYSYPSFSSRVSVQYQVQYTCSVPPQQYNNNHTSQYTSRDPISYTESSSSIQYPSPPPAHEDQDFMPPPPPLPLPEFSQGCHKGSHVEFSDPNEEKTFTVLLSEDDSKTTNLIPAGALSPSREVLDLSLPKQEKEEVKVEVKTNGHCEGNVDKEKYTALKLKEEEEEPKKAIDDDPSSKNSLKVKDEKSSLEVKKENDDFENLEEDSTISIEPSAMPSMPNAILAIQSQLEEYLNGLTEEEWVEFEESGIFQEEKSDPKEILVIKNDQSRLDCRYCGIIFTSTHVRKFHEESHKESKYEDKYDDGEDTRLFCGFCGKMFNSIKYRKLCELTHNANDIHLLEENSDIDFPFCCQFCGRQFRLESELIAHNKLFCTAERFYKQQQLKKLALKPSPLQLSQSQQSIPPQALPPPPPPKVRPRLIDQEGWVEDHPSLPKGWRMKTRPRPSQEGQVFSVFLSPDLKVLHSRKAVIEHMKEMGTYAQEDYDRVKEGAKPGPRKGQVKEKKRKNVFEDENKTEKKMKTDLNDSVTNVGGDTSMDSTLNITREESFSDDDDELEFDFDASDSEAEGNLCTNWREHHSLFAKWKMRAVEEPTGRTSFEYLSPDGTIFQSRREMVQSIKKPSTKKKRPVLKKRSDVISTNHLKRKMPIKKKLVTNQVIVTKATNRQRKLFMKDNKKKVQSDSFRYEPVIFVPKIINILDDSDYSDYDEERENFSIEVDNLLDIKNLPTTIESIKSELTARQLDYESKLSSSEDEEDEEGDAIQTSTPGGRSLRKRNARLVYEEPPLEEELDIKFFRDLKQQAKSSSVEKSTGKVTPLTSNSVEPTETESICDDELSEVENDEDYFSDSWEAELFSLKRNPREKMRFQDDDNEILNDWFENNPYPDKKEQTDISKILMVPTKNIKNWFQSKRVKCKENGKALNKRESKKRINCDTETEDPKKIFYCKICRQSFSNATHLKLHMMRFHKDKLKKVKSKQTNKKKLHSVETNRPATRQITKTLPEIKVFDEMKEIDQYIESKRSFNKYQLKELEHFYKSYENPRQEDVAYLSKDTKLSVNAINGWISNKKYKESIEKEVEERLLSSPSILKYSGKTHLIEREKWVANRNRYCHGKRSSLNYFQKTYLKSYFMLKQFVDTDDSNELSSELLLSSELINNFFEEARDKKDISDQVLSTSSKGKNRGRPKKISLEQSKIYFDTDDEDLFDIEDVENQTSSLPVVFASKSRGSIRSETGSDTNWTEYQRTFLEKFYEKIENPDEDDLDFLVNHVESSRQSVKEWISTKNKEKEYQNKESVKSCKDLLNKIILEISMSKNFTFSPVIELACKYCGDKFIKEDELREHENIEAEEFEPEKFENLTSNDLESIDTPEESIKNEELFALEEDELESITYASSHYDDSVDISINGSKRKQPKKEKELSINFENRFSKEEVDNTRSFSSSPTKRFQVNEFCTDKQIKSFTKFKGYFCKLCQLGFYLKSNLIKHLRTVHPNLPIEPIKQYELQVGVIVGRDEPDSRHMQCDDCKLEFKTRSELSRHLYLHYQDLYETAEPIESVSNGSINQFFIDDSRRSNLFYDEEPVTFEAFRQYFDSDDREKNNTNDPQDFCDFGNFKNISTPLTKLHKKSTSNYKEHDEVRSFKKSIPNYKEYEEEKPYKSYKKSIPSYKEYDDFGQRKEKERRTKIKFSDYQKAVLLQNFHKSLKMNKQDFKNLHEELADTLELPVTNVKVWFQNAKSARRKGHPLYL